MNWTRSLLLLGTGAVAGIAFVVSCSEHPKVVDAAPAVCDCPAAEPPLIVSRYQVAESSVATVAANGTNGATAACPPGTLFLSGSCTTDKLNPIRDVTVQQSGLYSAAELGGWHCEFKNNEATPVDVRARVICLKPGP